MDEFTYSGSELELFADAHHWKAYWKSHVTPYVGSRVLDVGAGIGSNLALMWQEGALWTCLEPDGALCQRIERKVHELGLQDAQCRIVQGTLASFEQNELFDTILFMDVLEHIEEDKAQLHHASARLCAGGHLIVLAPAHQSLFSAFDTAIGHYRRYDAASLRAITPDGLKLVRLRYLDAAGLLASAANRWMLRSPQPTPQQIALWDTCLVPVSRRLDKLLAYRLGKSILAIWQKQEA